MALTVQKMGMGPIGPMYLTVFTIKGDGSTTTYDPGILKTNCYGIWMANIDDTDTTPGIVYWSDANTVTWSDAIDNGLYQTLCILHKP